MVASCLIVRHYAKEKKKSDRGGLKLLDSEISEIVDINAYRKDMQGVVDNLKQEYLQHLVLRTSVGTFERMPVKTKDGIFPMNQLASIIQKNPTLLVLNLFHSVQYVPDVMATLQQSGMNLNPQQDGPSTIYITLQKVSHEHREQLAKSAKTLFNNAKKKLDVTFTVCMKEVHKEHNKKQSFDIKVMENQLLTEKNKYVAEAENMMKLKQKELLGESGH